MPLLINKMIVKMSTTFFGPINFKTIKLTISSGGGSINSLQSVKIILVHPKRELVFGALSNYCFFQFCIRNIGISVLLPIKNIALQLCDVVALNILYSVYVLFFNENYLLYL